MRILKQRFLPLFNIGLLISSVLFLAACSSNNNSNTTPEDTDNSTPVETVKLPPA